MFSTDVLGPGGGPAVSGRAGQSGPISGSYRREARAETPTRNCASRKRGTACCAAFWSSRRSYILGPFGEDCDLRRFGQALSVRGERNAKKRAVVAVARKLAVLLDRKSVV